MESNISTVAFRSNLYPVEKSFYEDSTFRSKIHDPFSLEILKKQCALTSLQKKEYDSASVHCAYAAKNDYPWGTIRDQQGHEQVICRCLNTKCSLFHSCRPDFDLSELAIYEENKRAQPAIFELEEAARKKRASEDGDAGAAAKLFAGDTPEQKHAGESGTPTPAEKKRTIRSLSGNPFSRCSSLRKSGKSISVPLKKPHRTKSLKRNLQSEAS